jgi:ribosomal protein L11 methyltransferase
VKSKALWKISVVTSTEAEDAISELFLEIFGRTPSSYTDVETREVSVTIYLETKPALAATRTALSDGLSRIKSCGLKIGAGKISFEKIRREDWAESWKRHFKPIEIGGALLIKPSWSTRRAKKNQAVVILDPGLSFGTGQHPTTGFCLQQLAGVANSKLKTQNPKRSFLDIGTGSGILAISAAKLGYSPIEAFDFDPEAVRVARENARRNRVLEKIRIHRADVTKMPLRRAKKYSVVCANLISTLLISERDRIVAALGADGILVLAGILQTEFLQVQRAYEKAGLKLITSRSENEWRSGAFAFESKLKKI